MKLNKLDISILKNFSSINPVILIKEGNILTSGIPNIIKVTATISNAFPKRFALDNLPKFIHILELFKEPNIEFLDNMVIVSSIDGYNSFKLMYTEETIIQDLIPPDRQIILPSIDIDTTIDEEVLSQLMKALRVLGLSEIHFYGDGKEVFVGTMDSENPSSDSYSIRLGGYCNKFRAVFKAEYFNLYSDKYEVSICKKGIARFKSDKLEYFLTMNNNASYFE